MTIREIIALLAVAVSVVAGTLTWLRTAKTDPVPAPEHKDPAEIRYKQRPASFIQGVSLPGPGHTQSDSTVAESVEMLRAGVNYPLQVTEGGAESATFPTVRTALLAKLAELGGVEAARCAEEIARSTSDPLELALCARILDEQEPKQHRAMLAAAARRMLAGDAPDKAPLLQLLAMFDGRDALPYIERMAVKDLQNSEPAVVALILMRDGGGDEALLRLWQSPDLPPNSRARVAWGVGVAAVDDESAQDVFQQMMSDPTVDRQWKQEALNGLETGEIWMDERLLPRTKVTWALPTSKWLAARLEVLNQVEPGIKDQLVVAKLQQVRDELVEELGRTQ